MAEILTALGTLFTSFSFEIVILIIMIALIIYYLVKLRPDQQKKDAIKEEEHNKREKEFLEAMTRNDTNAKNTIVMYEKALDNSTRALENSTRAIQNNTATLNMVSVEISGMRENCQDLENSVEKLTDMTRDTKENVVKAVTLIESKSK